ncbi:MFS transporter [Alicyclobacillus sp. ALC3]|uniref:MFS transporter n=1 Tax=Alicyclobacillus sp. ALC3 TaxID=2796143 RepID=UPI002378CF33|nr:MFS transporter [Alicyclobacillus sp. ALC3]WDL97669.1 MFS transporter [Alicyclobacillus sp. ALC3]
MASVVATVTENQSLTPEGRRTVWAAFFGFTVDIFDVYLPTIALGPALTYFEAKSMPASTALTWFYVTFAASLLGRPLGSFIFGHMGDRWGRRKTTLWAVGGFGIVTLLMTLLPGYRSIGMASLALLAVLRFIDGVFLGGEYTGATPLAMENSPSRRRGMLGGFINGGTGVAFAAISVVTLISLHIFPESTGQYSVWGWRIPFAVEVILALILWTYYYKTIEESPLWRETEKIKYPLKELFSGAHFRRLVEVFIVMTGVWFVTNSTEVPIPGLLEKDFNVSSSLVTSIEIVANMLMLGSFILAGYLSDKIGRKKMLSIMGGINIVIAPFIFLWMLSAAKSSPDTLWVILPVLFILTNSVFGVLSAYITERFSTRVRSSGYGIGYSLGIVIPSFSSFYMLGLKSFMPYADTGIVLLVVSGVLILVGSLLGPETRGKSIVD